MTDLGLKCKFACFYIDLEFYKITLHKKWFSYAYKF